jgi:hypothetical protein
MPFLINESEIAHPHHTSFVYFAVGIRNHQQENLHIRLQDMKCKTSNQLNGFEQIFSDIFRMKVPRDGEGIIHCSMGGREERDEMHRTVERN